jgi:hypothetical protein
MRICGRRGILSAGLVAACTVNAAAQEVDSRLRGVASFSAAILRSDDRGGTGLSLGGGLGIERGVTQILSTRLVATAYRAMLWGNDVFVPCPPPGACSNSVFPNWLLVTELQGLFGNREGRLKLLGGVGMTFPLGGHRAFLGTPPSDSSSTPRATLRAGVEWRLGGRSKPRLQLTRSAYTKSIFSLDWLDALGITVPF